MSPFRRWWRPAARLAAMTVAAAGAASIAFAQDAPNPFSDVPDRPVRRRPTDSHSPAAVPGPMTGTAYDKRSAMQADDVLLPSPGGADAALTASPPGLTERNRGVERGDLAPIPGTEAAPPAPGMLPASGAAALPADLWRGIDMGHLEAIIARLEIPPRSPALHALWRRVMTAEANAPAGTQSPQAFALLRYDALMRSGLVRDVVEALGRNPEAARDPALAVLLARGELALGHRDKGCAVGLGLSRVGSSLPKPLRGELLLMTGYCAAAGGNKAGAGLAADMAREEGLDKLAGLSLLDAVATGGKPHIAAKAPLTLIEFRLAELAGGIDNKKALEHARPALLAALASDSATQPALRVAAAEAAARINAVTPAALAEVYRATPSNRADAASTRAELLRSAESEHNPQNKARLIRGFIDEAKRVGLYLPALDMMAKASAEITRVPEIGWYAETAVEIALASGNFGEVRRWVEFGQSLDQPSGNNSHIGAWLALADIADASPGRDRGQSLATIEQLALRGRIAPELLHRLATVLDALDYQVPIPLWEAASRTPQPAGGHLPATGVLTDLQDASKKKDLGRTAVLAMDALGPDGAEGAHMIALGDAIRALRRAGLDSDARRLGLEALLAQWPRSSTR